MGCGASSALNKELQQHGRNEKINVHYAFHGVLGVGNFGTVREGVNKETGETVAVKRIPRATKLPAQKLIQEIEVMRKVDHPCCIRLLDLFYDDLHVYLVQELARGGELLERIAAAISFTERDAALIFRQILRGLEYLHGLGIAHRDMKPENILMVSRDVRHEEYYAVKLADYGFASLKADVIDDTMKTPCGTPEYIAPEIIVAASNRGDPKCKYSAKVDVWSAGAILYTMLCGTSPFLCNDTNTMLLMIRDGRYAFAGPAWQHVTNAAQSFIARILKVNPKVRPTASECLKDPWILQAEQQQDAPLSVKDALSHYCHARKAKRAGIVVQAVGRFALRPVSASDTEEAASRRPSAWSADDRWKGILGDGQMREGGKAGPSRSFKSDVRSPAPDVGAVIPGEPRLAG